MLLSAATYAALYIDNLRTGEFHQVGIVSGEQAAAMLETSTDPRRLRFELLES